jgi:hypothetical protein
MNLDNSQWPSIKALLESLGVPLDGCEPGLDARVVVVSSGLDGSVRELARSARDQVLMVRVDKDTLTTLDRWIAAGLGKSRSEAAAVFIREGLNLRAAELDSLSPALAEVEAANARLRTAASRILGGLSPGGRAEPAADAGAEAPPADAK